MRSGKKPEARHKPKREKLLTSRIRHDGIELMTAERCANDDVLVTIAEANFV